MTETHMWIPYVHFKTIASSGLFDVVIENDRQLVYDITKNYLERPLTIKKIKIILISTKL